MTGKDGSTPQKLSRIPVLPTPSLLQEIMTGLLWSNGGKTDEMNVITNFQRIESGDTEKIDMRLE